MIMLTLLDLKNDTHLGEESLTAHFFEIPFRVEPKGPSAGALDVAQDVFQRVHGDFARRLRGRVRKPGLDAAVVVGLGFEDDGVGGRVGGGGGC